MVRTAPSRRRFPTTSTQTSLLPHPPAARPGCAGEVRENRRRSALQAQNALRRHQALASECWIERL